MQLSNRLKAVAALVTEGNRVADIGCDHGYVPISLIEEGKIPSAIAMDINRGPLLCAQEHIEACGLSGYIETRLSDGLRELGEDEADTVIIAGMGGGLMQKIMREGEKVLSGVSELVLQPQSELAKFRIFLVENGYRIADENMIYEDGKYYPMMRVVHGESPVLTEMELRFGPVLIAAKSHVLLQFMERETRLKTHIQRELSAIENPSAEVQSKLEAVGEELALLEAARKIMQDGA